MIAIHYIYIAWDETVDGLTLRYFRGSVRVESTVQAGLVTLDTVSRDNGTMEPADTADQRPM